MDFIHSETHQILRDSVRKFAESEIAPVARELDKQEKFSENLTRKMGQLGLFGIIVPEQYGGHGMDYLAYAIACEEVARVDGSQAATITAHNSLGIGPLYYFGNDAQHKKYLPQLCTGEKPQAGTKTILSPLNHHPNGSVTPKRFPCRRPACPARGALLWRCRNSKLPCWGSLA